MCFICDVSYILMCEAQTILDTQNMSHELRCVCVYVQPCALFSCVSHKLSWILRTGVTNSFLRMLLEFCDPQWCTKLLKYDQYVKRDPRTCDTNCVRHLRCISSIVRRVFLVLICTRTSIHTRTHTHTRSLSLTHTHSVSLCLSLSHTRTHTLLCTRLLSHSLYEFKSTSSHSQFKSTSSHSQFKSTSSHSASRSVSKGRAWR